MRMRDGPREDRVRTTDSVNCRSGFGRHLDADLGMLVPAELSATSHGRRAVGDRAPACEVANGECLDLGREFCFGFAQVFAVRS